MVDLDTFMSKMKVLIYEKLQKNAFLTVMLCASIPNPLFDLAGITCGHFLISFWTFFGATVIGKAFIKMHAQVRRAPKPDADDNFCFLERACGNTTPPH